MGSSTDATESPAFKWTHDVFLSFRGEDTRSNFTSHLDMALRQNGANVFIDYKLERGEQISETLLRTIQEALISIVVFSQNYASSSWCLDELVKIMDCKQSKGQIVWPIFYKVDPSDVRKQTGSFGEALAKHQANFNPKTQIWREALTTAANLSGFDLGNYGTEAKLIKKLVDEVSAVLNRKCTPLFVANYPVGIDGRLQHMNLQSRVSKSGVYMLGICGIGGLGKTTLAKALYNKIATQFEGCCFLPDVREASKQFKGLVQLQENLLFEILKDNLRVFNLDRGINIIRNRLRSKKVLIVLDDVDKREQLEALAGGRDWFGEGSKIVVTTRNSHLLYSRKFDQVHFIEGLNEDESFELFCWNAFEESHPSSNSLLDLSKRATSYCKGHPLALVVLGSFLRTRYETDWTCILDGFENSLGKDIKDVLQLSFDGLEDKVKDIFLDISCFFVGEEVERAKRMLNACHQNLDFRIVELVDLSLVTIEGGKVQMHELIKQMGHQIVCDESSEPGRRSRLWLMEPILEVLDNNLESDAIKGIKLELDYPTRVAVDPQAFRNMKNLRLLIVKNARVSTEINYLPSSLKWIQWHGFAQPSLPSHFIMKNLVGLDLQHSFISEFGKGLQDCEKLKYVDLSHSTLLRQIPDFSAASNLEELYLSNCTNLRTIDKSVFSLNKLTILKLDGCSNLKTLPTSYFLLWSLQHLNLSYCNKLERIPDFSSASNLKSLYLEECTNLIEIDESVGSLDKLVALVLTGCTNLVKLPSRLRLKSLDYLGLSRCRKLENFPTIDENMRSLRLLDLDFTAIKELPSSIEYLTKLCILNLNNCTNLISLPETIYLLMSLWNLDLRNCKLLQEIPNLPQNIQKMDATGCKSLATSPDIIVDIISRKQDLALGEISREFILMNTGIPEWFSYKTRTNLMSASFRHYPDMERTLAACVSFKVNGDSSKTGALISCSIFICNRLHCSFTRSFIPSKSEYLWLVTTSLAWGSIEVQDWTKVLVWFEVVGTDVEVNVSIGSCGVHVTEELHGIQTDLKWPVVHYADFYQPEKLQNPDTGDFLLKSAFQGICCYLNCKATLHAASFDPETIDSKIQPTVFPLHITCNGDTVIRGTENMRYITVANSLCNKFSGLKDHQEGLQNSGSFFVARGRDPDGLAKGRGNMIFQGRHGSPRDTITSKNYLITFENLNETEYEAVDEWVRANSWISTGHGTYDGTKYHLLIKRLDNPFGSRIG